MGRPILGYCGACTNPVTPGHVQKLYGSAEEGYARLVWTHDCEAFGAHRLTWKAYQRLRNRWNDYIDKSQKSYDTETIGKLVQGFRIDLDAVGTVADIQLLWEDQARHRPATIPAGGDLR